MRIYKKFTNSELPLLEGSFKKCSFYPNRGQIRKLAKALKTNSGRIENWFKYKRRKMYFCGNFSQYKIRKIFTDEENDLLNSVFFQNKKPDYRKCKDISNVFKDISCYQIKNWFSNRRRKMRNENKCHLRQKKLVDTTKIIFTKESNEESTRNGHYKEIVREEPMITEKKEFFPEETVMKTENFEIKEKEEACDTKTFYNTNYQKSNSFWENQLFSNNQVASFLKYYFFFNELFKFLNF